MIVRLLLALSLLAPLQQVDSAIQDAMQRARRPALERPMRFATDLGHPAVVFGVLLVIAIFTGSEGPATARLALVALAPTNLIVEGLKLGVDRVRPDGDRNRSNSSFPSSHAANATALALVLAWRWRRAASIFWAIAGVVTISRVYLNRHYASDVLFGAVIGIACALWAKRWTPGRGTRAAPSG